MSEQFQDSRRFSSPAVLQNNGPTRPSSTPYFRPERIALGTIVNRQDQSRLTGRTSPQQQTLKPLPKRPHSHLSPVQEIFGNQLVQTRPQAGQEANDGRTTRWSGFNHPFSRQWNHSEQQDASLTGRWSHMSKRLSRPLSFNGSVWLKQPEDFVLQFQFSEDGSGTEYFDLPHHVFDRKKKKRLVYLVSLAAMFSPLSSNIYFPALDTISKVLLL
jgi:hypothetical protein